MKKSIIKIVSLGVSLLFLNSRVAIGQTLYRSIDSPNDSYNVNSPPNTYEFYGMEVQNWENEGFTRLVIDSNLPLSGVTNTRSADNHIGIGEVFIRHPNTGEIFAIKFAENETTLENGIYTNINTVSLVNTNYGAKDMYGTPTNISSGEYLSGVDVYNLPGLGTNGGNKIVIEFPNDILPEGKLLWEVIQECANDRMFLETFTEPYIPGIPDTPDIPDTPGIPDTPDDPGSPPVLEDGDSGAIIAASIGGLVILAIILLSLGGGDNMSDIPGTPINPDTPDIPDNPDTPEDPNPQEIPEGDTSFLILLLTYLFSKRRKTLC